MTAGQLIRRSLRYYWRTNLAVALGVGVAVAALGGALVVGESVRHSLRELALARLGRAEQIVSATVPFTEQLADRVASAAELQRTGSGAAPVLALEGVVIHEGSGRRAGGVQVFGVDDRFWAFHGIASVTGPVERDALLSGGLARELGVSIDDSLLLRLQKPSAMPSGILQGQRDQPGRAVRLRAARVLPREELGDFAPRPQQGEARTMFVPLDRLQRDIELPHRINMMLIAGGSGEHVGRVLSDSAKATADRRAARQGGPLAALPGRVAARPDLGEGWSDPPSIDGAALTRAVEAKVDLADLGVRLRPIEPRGGSGQTGRAFVVESDAGYLPDALAQGASEAARRIGVEPVPVLTYLANTIRANGRETPYSLVSALPQAVITAGILESALGVRSSNPVESRLPSPESRPIWLSQWTADDLAAKPGDKVALDYYLWSDAEGLLTSSAEFEVAGVLPMSGLATDPDLTSDYPGVSTAPDISEWDPPFPVDLSRIRPKDEDFWDSYLTSPKAFIRLEDGQALWRTRYGQHTAIRVPAGDRAMTELHAAYAAELARHVPPRIAEFKAIPVRADALAAASGTTDFGEYFTYFSFFLVVSSLLLTVLFFRLGIEQRAHEIGLLGAMGYTPRRITWLLVGEGALVALAGAVLGMAGALGYSAVIMVALRTLWVGAVGTTELQLHASMPALLIGATGGILTAIGVIVWSLRVLRRASVRQLMSGGWLEASGAAAAPARTIRLSAMAAAGIAVALVIATSVGVIPEAAGFFGSGTLLLVAGLCGLVLWLRRPSRGAFVARPWPLFTFGVRNARYRPARSVLSAALIAAATFLIVSVGAFRLGVEDLSARDSGAGGYSLIAETIAPLMHDPGTDAGREALNLGPELSGLDVARFRLRPGDDTSCLNLYRPQNPRLLGATDAFIYSNRFAFSNVIDGDASGNGWLLLDERYDDGAVPVIGDATSLAYVFHLGVGDDYVMQGPDGQPLHLRIVGALRDSVLQSELVMSEAQFTRLFPRQEGYRVFLIGAEPARVEAVAAGLEDRLQDFGMDVQSTAERLAAYHRVQNTYVSTFQALGALGLILGTFGLGTVLLRNVLEQRRQLALLRATGYRRIHLVATVMAESSFLLACGLVLGLVSALVAIAPAYAGRGQPFPVLATLGLLAGVFISGLLSTVMATRTVSSSALLPALKNE